MEITIIRVGRGKRHRPTLRDIAQAVCMLQQAESLAIHASRDQCLPCLLASSMMRMQGTRILPEKYLKDPAWLHDHIEMPGARLHLRQAEESHQLGGSDD